MADSSHGSSSSSSTVASNGTKVASNVPSYRDVIELGKILEHELNKHPEERALMERCETEVADKMKGLIFVAIGLGQAITVWRTPTPRIANAFGSPLRAMKFSGRVFGWSTLSFIMGSSFMPPMNCSRLVVKNPESKAGLIVRHQLRSREAVPQWLVKFDQDHPNDRTAGATAAAAAAVTPTPMVVTASSSTTSSRGSLPSSSSRTAIRDRDLLDPEVVSAQQSVAAVIDARQPASSISSPSSSSPLSVSDDVIDTRRRIVRDTKDGKRDTRDDTSLDRYAYISSSTTRARDPNHKYKTFSDIRKEHVANGIDNGNAITPSSSSSRANRSLPNDRDTRSSSPIVPRHNGNNNNSPGKNGSNGKRVNEYGDEIFDS